jgi:hypothetical protein
VLLRQPKSPRIRGIAALAFLAPHLGALEGEPSKVSLPSHVGAPEPLGLRQLAMGIDLALELRAERRTGGGSDLQPS